MSLTGKALPPEEDRQLGATIKKLREEAGLTQEAAAARMECVPRTWARIENGEFPTRARNREDALLRVAGVLKISVEQLTGKRERGEEHTPKTLTHRERIAHIAEQLGGLIFRYVPEEKLREVGEELLEALEKRHYGQPRTRHHRKLQRLINPPSTP